MKRSHQAPAPSLAGDEPPAPLPGVRRGARVWLVRHAQVHEDWQGRAYGDLDVPLSEDGRARTAELAAAFSAIRPALVATSPLTRAHRLGKGIAESCGAPLEVDPRLAEIHRGSWQGLGVAELHERHGDAVRAFYADPWSFRDHGGENDAMLCRRAGEALAALLERVPTGTLVVTSHYNVIRVLAARALGVPPARSFALRVDPGRAILLVDGPQGWDLLHSNAGGPPADGPRR